MAHDFAKQRAARAKNAGKPPVSGWLWLACGIVIGTLASFLVYLATLAPHPQRDAKQAEAQPEAQAAPKSSVPAEKPQFDFYTLLPESEIIVDSRQSSAAKDASRTSEREKQPSLLLLQAGSFRQLGEADRRRAEILLLDLKASVETVTVNGGETWHRVHVGPFASAEELTAARRKLLEHHIDALEISKRA
jgi:cell division protein FtsN